MDTDATRALWAITPLDGRYRAKLEGLESLVSEGALTRYRIRVEAAWLLHLEAMNLPDGPVLAAPVRARLEALEEEPPAAAAERVKQLEAETNHDVKAVEYYLREVLRGEGADDSVVAYLHFACTSEDINNLSYALMLEELRRRWLPLMNELLARLDKHASREADTAMLARTHGQTASPTTLGKEFAVFIRRLGRARDGFAGISLEGKLNGAVGNYNAHMVAFPDVDWPEVSRRFVTERLGLAWNPLTTQIENHDTVVEYVQALGRFNTILLDLCRDVWGYVSLGYFRQKAVGGEVGSSTMPHKVNPIDFENAEGNLGVAGSIGNHFADKLPVSRWQRDLSDSTVLRSLAEWAGHSELAWRSALKGLGKLEASRERIAADLDGAWEVLAEAVQTVMRRYGVADAYERLKSATRGRPVDRAALKELIDGCDALPDEVRTRLKALSPSDYVGRAPELARTMAGQGPRIT